LTDLPGGVLESVGRLFNRSMKMYVYPARDPVTGEIQSAERARMVRRSPHRLTVTSKCKSEVLASAISQLG
jgi:hypothetical protein